MIEELPKGWIQITLQDAGIWRSGGTPSRRRPEFFGKGIPWVKSGDLPDGPILKTDEQITKIGLENSAAKLMPAGTISIALYGATIGKLGVLTFPAATNQACANIIPDTRIVEPKFLFNYLLSERKSFIEQGQGGAQPNISQEIVRTHPFPLAPLAEQRRIVAKLEALLGKVDACQQRLAKIPVLLKRFRQSVLAAACSGRLTADWREENPDVEPPEQLVRRIFVDRNNRYKATCDKCIKAGTKPPKRPKNLVRQAITRDDLPEVPKEWEIVCWDDLADWITYGFTRPMPHVEKGIPIITAKNVRDGFLDWAQPEYTTKEAFAELSEKDKPRRNEILITKDGAIRGRAALVETDEPFCISQAVAVVRFGGLTAHEKFLLLVVRSKFTQNLIEAESMGTAIPHISITNFGRFPVPLPPLAEQQEIVRRVEALFALADQIETRFAKARAQVDKLTPSLLAKAFRGQLVPQDPADEPAEKLLERIRQGGRP